jgi:hypothetical protein
MNLPPALEKQLGTHFDSDLVNVSDKNDVLRAASEASVFLTSDSATIEGMTDVATYLRAFLSDLPEAELSKLGEITNAEWSEYLPNLTAAFAHMLSQVESELRTRAR